jgi:hypothetical protein
MNNITITNLSPKQIEILKSWFDLFDKEYKLQKDNFITDYNTLDDVLLWVGRSEAESEEEQNLWGKLCKIKKGVKCFSAL